MKGSKFFLSGLRPDYLINPWSGILIPAPPCLPTGPGPTILGPGPLCLDLGPQGPGPDFGQST